MRGKHRDVGCRVSDPCGQACCKQKVHHGRREGCLPSKRPGAVTETRPGNARPGKAFAGGQRGGRGQAERWGAWVSAASCARRCRQSRCWTFKTHQKPSRCLSGSPPLVSGRHTALASLQMIQQQPAGTLHSCRQPGSFPWARLSNVLRRWPVIPEGSPQASSPGDLAWAPPWPPRCPPPWPTRLRPPPLIWWHWPPGLPVPSP